MAAAGRREPQQNGQRVAERREMGALEGDVLGHLWAGDGPLSAAEVRVAMGEVLAYTTVLTVLNRLWNKGLVERETRGRANVYRPVVSEADLTARRMRAQLERSADPQKALASFVGSLSETDELALRQIMDRVERLR